MKYVIFTLTFMLCCFACQVLYGQNYGLVDTTPKACTQATNMPKACTPAQVYETPAPKACTPVKRLAPVVSGPQTSVVAQEQVTYLGSYMEMPDGSLQSMDSYSSYPMMGNGNCPNGRCNRGGFSMSFGGGSRCPR